MGYSTWRPYPPRSLWQWFQNPMGSISGSDRQYCMCKSVTVGCPPQAINRLHLDCFLPFLLFTLHKLITDLPRLLPARTGILLFFKISWAQALIFSMGYQKPGNTKQDRRLVPASRGDQVLVSTGPVTSWLTGISCKIPTVWVNVHQWLKRSSPKRVSNTTS